MKEKEIVKGAM